MLIRLGNGGPLHTRVHSALRGAVLDGSLRPGTRLPATRALANDLGISRTVVVRAYERLASEGYLEGRVGAGTFVREGLAPPEPPLRRSGGEPPPRLSRWAHAAQTVWQPPTTDPPRFDFRYGRVDVKSVPRVEWRKALRRAARAQSVEYSPPEGSPALRLSISAHLARTRGVRCAPEQILIVTGSQQALDLTARVLLDRGDAVALEEPHYQGARHAFFAAGAELRLFPVDEEGIQLEGAGAVRLAYVTPSHQFPSGGVLSLSRRLALLEWARRVGAWILEDDYDAEFRYDLPPVEAVHALDPDGRVIYAGTFSKVLFPSLRIGYLVLPSSLVPAFRTAKWLVDRHSPTLEQEALAILMAEGAYERHLRRTRLVYGRRRAALLAALEHELGDRARVVGAHAGVHVLVWLDELAPKHLPRVVAAALARGVGVYSVTPYYAGPPPGAGLLMGYAALDEPRIGEGVRRLRLAVDETAGR